METVISIYQLTNTLITLYGYWKTAGMCYDNYQRTKLLFETIVGILNKLQHMIDNSKEDLILPIDKIEEIKNDIENSKYLPRIFYSKKPFKTHWEILHKHEIKKQIDDDKQEVTHYLLPNIVNFYSYTDENGNTISEL